VLVELLNGRFPYQPKGLLDDTHIHFFTRDSLYECLEEAGFTVTWLERVEIEPEHTEFRTDLSPFSADVRALVESRDEANTYQFILTAHPVPAANATRLGNRGPRGDRKSELPLSPALLDPVLEGAVQLPSDGALQAIIARVAFLESGRQHQTELLGSLRQQLLRSEVHIGSLDAQVRQWRDAATRLQEAVDAAHPHTPAPAPDDDLRRAHEAVARRLLAERLRFGTELASLQRDRDLLTERLQQVEALARQRDERIQQLEWAIQQYERSRSWRITAPMRAALATLRRWTRPRP
jgi:hypothetical protein